MAHTACALFSPASYSDTMAHIRGVFRYACVLFAMLVHSATYLLDSPLAIVSFAIPRPYTYASLESCFVCVSSNEMVSRPDWIVPFCFVGFEEESAANGNRLASYDYSRSHRGTRRRVPAHCPPRRHRAREG